MNNVIMPAKVTALSSIAHGGETHGNTSMFRREKIYLPKENMVIEIPVYSGNAMRGMLRDIAMFHLCREIGYGEDDENGVPKGLPLAAFRLLFSGGSLTSEGKRNLSVTPGGVTSHNRGLDIDAARHWRQLIPALSVFGSAAGNQMLPGKVSIGKVYPICQETAHIVPEEFLPEDLSRLPSIWDLTQMEQFTRRDDGKDERFKRMIDSADVKRLEDEETRKASKRGTAQEEPVGETGKSQQMIYDVETLCAGTEMFWEVILLDPTDIEMETFIITLAQFGKTPYIGGKSGTGHGKVSIQFGKWITIDSRAKVDGQEVGHTFGTKYLNHLREHGAEIKAMLDAFS